jgi:hypothetical protein
MKENDFFLLKNLGTLYAWSTHAEVSQEYEYPKNIRYRYGFIFGAPCFIGAKEIINMIIANRKAKSSLCT